jgi:hypothetical protein
MSFREGKAYSRAEIAARLGGQLRDYLPTREGRVVCGCFHKSPAWNPGAPQEVLFGPGPRVERAARLIAEQVGPIPVFLFDGPAAWRFVGYFRCTDISTDLRVRREKERRFPERGPIAGVLRFERA